ncbi:MAG: response regulator [Desulfobacterales bacterium]|nr:response regulator [Desulfobacterales bacterium]MBF0397080.1 response regulator [Desulfobacterales bacterium]
MNKYNYKIGFFDARILLVEDNPNNYHIKDMITDMGVKVYEAKSGLQAIEILFDRNLGSSCDAIIMNMQMTVMDGFETTSYIRMDSRFKNIPIIAMIDNVLEIDRGKYLKADINDYIVKPIDIKQLFLIITKWIKPKPVSESPKSLKNDFRFPESLPGLDIKGGITRMVNKPELYKRLLEKFKQDYTDAVFKTKLLLKEGKIKDAERFVHSLKGVSGNLGAERLKVASEMLEINLRKVNIQGIEELIFELEASLNEVLSSVKEFITTSPMNQNVIHKFDLSKISELVEKLKTMLIEENFDAEEVSLTLHEHLSNTELNAQSIEMRNHISGLNYSEGLKILEEIARRLNTL